MIFKMLLQKLLYSWVIRQYKYSLHYFPIFSRLCWNLPLLLLTIQIMFLNPIYIMDRTKEYIMGMYVF